MKVIYPVLFYEEKEGGYSVFVPDLKNNSTCGSTLEEAMAMAEDLIAGIVLDEMEENNQIPKSSKIEDVSFEKLEKYLEEECYSFYAITIGKHMAPEGFVIKQDGQEYIYTIYIIYLIIYVLNKEGGFSMRDIKTYLSVAPVLTTLWFGSLAGLLIEINRLFPDALTFPFFSF